MWLKTPNSDWEQLNIRSHSFSACLSCVTVNEKLPAGVFGCFMEILRVTTSSGKKVPRSPFFSPLCFTFLPPPPPRFGLLSVPSPHVSGNNNNIRHCFHSMLFYDDVASPMFSLLLNILNELWWCGVVMLTLWVTGSSQISKSTAFKD